MDYIIGIITTAIVVAAGCLLADYFAKRSCLKKLKKVGAISPETAVTAEEVGIIPSDERELGLRRLFYRALKALVKQGKIGIKDNRYYICKDKNTP